MKQQDLAAKVREGSGKGPARRLRAAGRVPAVFYGRESGNIHLEVGSKELGAILHSETGQSTFVNLNFEDKKLGKKIAIIKEVQIDPVSDKLIHADFSELHMNEKIEALVHVKLTGKAKGVELGGTLQPVRRELLVKCLPKDLPDVIEIDVTHLGVGESLHINEVTLPAGVETPHGENFTVATVLAKKGAAEEEAAAAAEAEAKA